MRKTCTERRKISLLKEVMIRKRFQENVAKLVDVGVPNLWVHFKDWVLEACDEMCWKKKGRKSNGDMWWWNEEVKEAVYRKKDAHKVMCRNSAEENKRRYKCKKNEAKKDIS